MPLAARPPRWPVIAAIATVGLQENCFQIRPAANLQSQVQVPRHSRLDDIRAKRAHSLSGLACRSKAGIRPKRHLASTEDLGRLSVILFAAATAATSEKPKALNLESRIRRMFEEVTSKGVFSENAWYECPEATVTTQKRIWEYWERTRPSRTLERIAAGNLRVGCTWKQVDGRRGASFFRFNDEGKVTFVREVPEPSSFSKFRENNMKSLQPAFGTMNFFKGMFNWLDEWYVVEEKNQPKPVPKYGLEAPKTRKAGDVVRYLWEEAQVAEFGAVEKMMAEFSKDVMFEDLTYVDESFPRGLDALRRYQEETKENAPENLRFVLDDIADGPQVCAALWHIEFNGQKKPRGISFYELDADGKVSYVRATYDFLF